MIEARERDILQALRSAGPLSRWELHERTGQTPNRVGTVVDGLMRHRLVRERDPEPQRAGRPRVPLEIDPVTRHLIGLAIRPGAYDVCRLGLTGDVLQRIRTPVSADPARLISSSARVLAKAITPATLGIGITVTGFIDPAERTLLLSSAAPGHKPASLRALDRAAGQTPLVLGNDMQALAARWLLARPAGRPEDVLLVWFDDGRIGSAFLAAGRPCRGVLAGGNEIGHVRFFVETDRCFCGQTGCLERIFSTPFLRRIGGLDGSLGSRIERDDGADEALREILRYFYTGIANAVNFLRPHRLVLVSPLAGRSEFRDAVIRATRELLLAPLREAVEMDFWHQPATESAENAAWLAHAELLWTGWDATGTPTKATAAR